MTETKIEMMKGVKEENVHFIISLKNTFSVHYRRK